MSTSLERFFACQEYQPCDRRPNYELGAWQQTRIRWQKEAPQAVKDFTWNFQDGEPALRMDRREFIGVNFAFIPPFEREVLERTDRYEIARNPKGIVTRALIEGTVGGQRMSMDEYIDFPVKKPEDFPAIKARLAAAIPARYPKDLDARAEEWKRRDYPLILGRGTNLNGFYWRAREFMGTQALSLAFFEYPELAHEIMAFYADFVMETSRPVLEKIKVDYVCFNEDLAMKTGPLLGPNLYEEFIFPHVKRLVEFFRGHGVRYIVVDSDGDPRAVVPLMMDAGVDTLWPLERASGMNPLELRKRFGRGLRLWGGVDKRVLPLGREAIKAHLRAFIPLIEEGGFIPHLDHSVPPDISWNNWMIYWEHKEALLRGDFGKLE